MTNDLHAKRAKLVNDWREVLDKAEAEGRALTSDEQTKVAAMEADIDGLRTTIDSRERLDKAERASVPAAVAGVQAAPAQARGHIIDASSAFSNWVRHGASGLSDEERAAVRMTSENGMPGAVAEFRAQSVGTTTAGGFTVAQGFSGQLEEALKFYGGMFSVADVVTTSTGAALPWPTVNDTAQSGVILAENTGVANQDLTFASVTLNAYKYSSKQVLVSVELMQDSAFDIDGLVAQKLGERLGRILNTHFTTGTGSSQPNGIVTAATLGKTGTTGQTATVIYDDLVDLVYAVDPAYRQAGRCRFMMNDASIKVIRKLKDSQGIPLWQPSVQMGQPDMLLGYPVVPNNDVATMAANAKSILFGDFSKYKIRRVKDITVLRLAERYADAHQVGFLAFARFDGNLIDAGTNPVKYYANSAT